MKKEEKIINAAEFIADAGVDKIVSELKAAIKQKEESGQPFVVSDVYDADGNQYADLVQEGGGVWGIALLGYTYVLEQVGIRFFSMAGTSAGAINTMLLASRKGKQDEKTIHIIKDLLELDLFSFVDGKKDNWRLTKWVKKLIQKFVLQANYFGRFTKTLLVFTVILLGFSLANFILSIVSHSIFLLITAISALLLWIIAAALTLLLIKKVKNIAKTGYGLNAGDSFYKWINLLLTKNGVTNLHDLQQSFCDLPPSLAIRTDEVRSASTSGTVSPPKSPMLVIVASDITTGNKVEFPRMWDMYWDNPADVPPAAFVRASMSIPIFFETYKLPISFGLVKVKEKWRDQINWNGDIPDCVKMIDGGVLSNFPINVFYNPNYIIPRMPTFGVRLGGDGIERANNLANIGDYASSILSTLRSTTDKNFINSNKAFTLGIKEVDMTGHSWLNFFMENKEKKEIFAKGAQAAAAFILNFDWNAYKNARLNNYDVLQKQRENPNNW